MPVSSGVWVCTCAAHGDRGKINGTSNSLHRRPVLHSSGQLLAARWRSKGRFPGDQVAGDPGFKTIERNELEGTSGRQELPVLRTLPAAIRSRGCVRTSKKCCMQVHRILDESLKKSGGGRLEAETLERKDLWLSKRAQRLRSCQGRSSAEAAHRIGA